MPCIHLTQLYKLCQDHDVRLSSSDLINVVCKQCGKAEVCPDTLVDSLESVPHDEGNDRDHPSDDHQSKS